MRVQPASCLDHTHKAVAECMHPASGAAAEGGVELLALPSKRVGLFADAALASLIARSDSNGEDLEAFAGAGEHLCSLHCAQLSGAVVLRSLQPLGSHKGPVWRFACRLSAYAAHVSNRLLMASHEQYH